MQDFRVIDLPERTTLDASDYAMIDSANNGTNKYLLSRMTAETDAKIATAVSGVEAELNTAVEGIEENITALQGDVETVETTLGTKADIDGTYPSMAVGSVLGSKTVTDREPYFLRPSASIGDRAFDTLVGGTLGWNQLCNGSSVTVTSGHKYYMIKGGAKSVGASDGTAITGLTSETDIVTDLTTLFGSTIADYVYGLEQATAGAGVAWFRQYFGKDYYPYSAPTLKSVEGLTAHEMVGFNQWDEEWEVGTFDNNTGLPVASDGNIRSKNFIPVLPSTNYYGYIVRNSWMTRLFYDANKNYISFESTRNGVFVTPNNAHYMKFRTEGGVYGTTYNHDICINLSWDGEKDGQYEPYVKHSYPLDSSLELRGIPKLDASNKLYYDGDTYAADGTVTRRYGIVDLGMLDWTMNASSQFFALLSPYGVSDSSGASLICSKYLGGNAYGGSADKAICVYGSSHNVWVKDSAYTDAATLKTAMSGVYLVYELATPTEETADPYTSPQIVDPDGTEEYVTTGLVPVGHETEYVENLADKLTDIPDLPTTAGTYRLKVTVTGGKASYEWVSA